MIEIHDKRRAPSRKLKPGQTRPGSRYNVQRRIGPLYYAPTVRVYFEGVPHFCPDEYLPLQAWKELAADDGLPDGLTLANKFGNTVTVMGRSVK